jgi:outer membrane protein assembly factor BamB
MAHDGMRDVVLSGEPEPLPEPRRDDEAAPTGASGARTGHRWAVVALLVVVVLLVAQVSGDRARAARLAAVPGLLPSLRAAPAPLWDVPGGTRHLVAADDDLLLSGFLEEGEQRLVAHDADSGERRWQTSLSRVPIGRSLGCELLGRGGAAVPTHVVCRLAAPRPAGVDYPGHGPGSEQRLVVLDAGTGRVLHDRSLGLGFVATAVHDGDVLVADVGPDGRVRLVRQDPVTGNVRWTFTSDDPLPGTGDGVGPQAPEVGVQHGVVVLAGPVSWALRPDGAVLGEWRSAGPAGAGTGGTLDVTVLADGGVAVADPGSPGRDGAPAGVVVTAEGDRFAIDGPVLRPVVDDGSAAGVLLTVPPGGGRVVAVDSSTGARLWEAAGFWGGEAMVIDRRLVTSSGNRLTARDTRTGRELWTASPGRLLSDQPLLTDGDVLAVPTLSGPTGAITGVALADGRVRWTAPGPDDVRTYLGAGGRLLALQEERTVLLG